jgi:murein DD-endopeptidase MepM/ murein hydrolase activator NlpD
MVKKHKHRVWYDDKGWRRKLKRRYKLVLMDEESFEEKISFSITRLGVLVYGSSLIIVLMLSTIYLVAFTRLREYIPGYTDVTLPEKIYELQQKVDSLEGVFRTNDLYVANFKNIIEGKEIEESLSPPAGKTYNIDAAEIAPSVEEAKLREEYESQSMYNLYENKAFKTTSVTLGNMNFFPPLTGIVTSKFNPAQEHFGIDIVATRNEAVKAVQDGTVIFSDWTLETGYVISLQHNHDLITVYKHNSTLLKQQGAFVRAGETISIIGESGELSTGPHLHFELWYKGKPVDPEEYIAF